MSVPADEDGAQADAPLPWYVYDRYANLLHVAGSLPDAEAWAFTHWGVVEVGDREQVTDHDYYYLLFAEKPDEGDFRSRDYQARILRQDRVIALGRDPQTTPCFPG